MVSRQTFHILLTLAVVFITACGEDSRMREILDQAERHNQDFKSMAGDTLLHQATAYYDRWGTSNERLRAHYLLGCHYRDLGEAPAALDEYQTAASLADTTRADCDYHTLCRVHGQMADVFYEHYLGYEAIEELRNAYYYSTLSHDTIASLSYKEEMSYAYKLMGDNDSALIIIKDVFYESSRLGLKKFSATCAYPIFRHALEQGNIREATHFLQLYKSDSGHVSGDSVAYGEEVFYYYWGKYFLLKEQIDSAEWCFRRIMSSARDDNDSEAAYKGLTEFFQFVGNNDSVAKYALLCYLTSEKNYQEASVERLSHLHSRYNYTRHKQAAQMKEAESRQLRSMLTIVILLSLLIILLFLGLFWYLRIRYKHELQIRTKEYEYRIEKIHQARIDLSNDACLDSSKKSQEELVSHENKLKELLHIGTCQNNTVDFCDTDIYHRLQYLVNHPKEKIEKKDYVALIRIFDERIPDFCFKLTNKHRIPEKDLYLCMLIRMNFGVSEICILLNTYSQYVSNRRKQLLTKYFKITGKPEDFDNIVRMVN